jgi:hypothetical protein
MTTAITVAVMLVMIAAGALLIRALNAQHDQRIASFPYGGARRNRRARSTELPEETGGATAPAARTREEHQGESPPGRRPASPATTAGGQRPHQLSANPRRVTASGGEPSEAKSDQPSPDPDASPART